MTYDEIMEWASRRSIFFPSAEIYAGSPAGFWDFGPYGAAIKRKITQMWRKELVQKNNMLEIYGSQILPEQVFQASGHLTGFNDPLTQCKKCFSLHRANDLLSSTLNKNIPESMPVNEMNDLLQKNNVKCPSCNGDLAEIKTFNMMIKTIIGATGKYTCYLRGEACQSIFLDFNRMAKTMRVTLPKGIAQAGRAFRNEISPRNSLFRMVEFSQMECEIFFNPKKIDDFEAFQDVKDYGVNIQRIGKETESITAEDLVKNKIVSGKIIAFYLAKEQQMYEKFGIKTEHMRFREVEDDERAFYAKETWDFEVKTDLGWIELSANNYRTDYDITTHSHGSKKDLMFNEDGDKFIPHVWEISIGLDRTFYAIVENALKKETRNNEEVTILAINPKLAPIEVSIFPLMKKEGMPKLAMEIRDNLIDHFDVFYDASGSIGKRYARVDEIGCPFAITVDFDSLKNEDVTLRDRDTQNQVRIKIKDLKYTLRSLIDREIQFSELKN